MATASGITLMSLTDLGRSRFEELFQGAVFSPAFLAVGVDGFDPNDPSQALPITQADIQLTAEIHREPLTDANAYTHSFSYLSTQTNFDTSSGSGAFNGILGEAGLYLVVKDAGNSNLVKGEIFLAAIAHFPRKCISRQERISLRWPITMNHSNLGLNLRGQGSMSILQ